MSNTQDNGQQQQQQQQQPQHRHPQQSTYNDNITTKNSPAHLQQPQDKLQPLDSQQAIPKIFSKVSAFCRYQPLTNLQRGNVFHDQACDSQIERSIFTLAAQGEICFNNSSCEPDSSENLPSDLRDERGRTLIHIAAAHGQLVTLRSLLNHFSRVKSQIHTLKDDDGCTALHYAAHGGHHLVVKELISSAKPEILHDFINAISSDGSTALMYACFSKHVQVVRELIKCKFLDLSLCNNNGDTAYSLAVKSENKELISIFDSHILKLLKGST